MARVMKAKLVKKELIAEGTWYMEFGGEEKPEFVPGQFFRLTLVDPKYTDDRGNARYLGFVNIPDGSGVAATVTRIGPSAFKRTLEETEIGLTAEIDGIGGQMLMPEDTSREMVIITGGIGIAPIMSLLRWEKEKSPGHKITLINSNTNRKRAIFLEELQEYEKSIPDFKLIATMTQDADWGGETRRIGLEFLKDIIDLNNNNLYFVTGTPRFAPFMVKNLRDIGVNPSQMKFEIFTGY